MKSPEAEQFEREVRLEQQYQKDDEEKQRAKKEHAALRDQFACAALTGLLSQEEQYASDEGTATAAYRLADAMLEAREAQP